MYPVKKGQGERYMNAKWDQAYLKRCKQTGKCKFYLPKKELQESSLSKIDKMHIYLGIFPEFL